MTLQNVRIEKEPTPSTDWRVYGDIQDNYGNSLGFLTMPFKGVAPNALKVGK